MDQVGRRVPRHRQVRRHRDLDPLVVLHLGQCRADDLVGGHRPRQRPSGVLPGEHQQVLAVAPHPGRQMVEFEQPAEDVRILLVLLHPVEHTELPLHQVLTPAGEIDEHRVHVLPQHRLFPGESHRLAVYRVERPGHLAQFLAGVHGHRIDGPGRRVLGSRVLLGQNVLDRGGEPVLRDVQCAGPQGTDRTHQRTGDDHRQHGGDEQCAEDDPRVQRGRTPGVGGQRVGAPLDLRQHRLLDLVGQVDGVGGRGVPLPRGQVLEPGVRPGLGEHRLHDAVADVHHQPDHGVGVHPLLPRGGQGQEVTAGGVQLRLRREERAFPVLGQPSPGQCLGDDRPLDRHLVLDPRERVRREPAARQIAVGDPGHGPVADVQHARDHLAVRTQHGLRGQVGVATGVAQSRQLVQTLRDPPEGVHRGGGQPVSRRGERPVERPDGGVDAVLLCQQPFPRPLPSLGDVAHGEIPFALELMHHLGDRAVHADPLGGLGEARRPVQVRLRPQPHQHQHRHGGDQQHHEQLGTQAPVA